MEFVFQKPRKIFMFLGGFVILLAVAVLYINYFVPELRFGRINVVSPYQSEARALSEKIANINSFHWSGEIKLKNIIAQNSSAIDLTNNKFKLDLTSLLQFNASSKKVYSLSTELKRFSPSDFYLKFSKASIPNEILILVEKFIGPWLRVDKNLMDQMLAEEPGYDFSEEKFLESLRTALKSASLFELTRKISDNHYSFNINPENLAEFLGKLFGDLSGQPFLPDELASVQDSFFGFNINGEVWINPLDGLPQQIKLNWNNLANADLYFKNFNQPTEIKVPAKSVSLEKLLQ
ncbi:MAG: hypothetical protein AAB847_00220 [Patescibacteria group bacterium]